MNLHYLIRSIKSLTIYLVAAGYVVISTSIIFLYIKDDIQASEQLVLKNLSNDIIFKDYRFAEQKYLGMCKIIKVDKLLITFDTGILDIDCAEKGFFVFKSKMDFNKSIYELSYRIDNYILYIIINFALCFLVVLLLLSSRKIEIQRSRMAELQRAQFFKEKQIYEQVAHDVRSPLSVLNMLVPTFAQVSDEKSELIMQAVGRINGIAEDLLRKGKSSNKESNYDIVDVIERVVEEKKIAYGNVDFKLKYSTKISRINICLNESTVSRVVSNLLNNSIEALPISGGEILLNLTTIENGLELAISDNGKGIPQSVLENVGKQGFSFGKENQELPGAGLGVFYCKSVVEQAGGTFKIRSTEGKGTSVEINLPFVN